MTTNILCSWKWWPQRRSVVYVTMIKSTIIRIIVQQKQDGKFNILTTQKSKTGNIRRMNKDCLQGFNKTKMKSAIHSLLCRYVSEGK